MVKRFRRKLGNEILKYGEEITWVLFVYPDAREKARIIYQEVIDDPTKPIPFETLFHIEKKLGNLGYEKSVNENWGIPIQIYHSYQAAKKGLYSHAVNLILSVKGANS